MSFYRTTAGLSNYKHFLNVNYKVYVEGESDIEYWTTVFSLHRPDLKISIEKKDGVSNLTPIINDIANGTINNVVVCRDSDYAVASGNIVHSDRIVYSYGYSFENDFFTEGAASQIVTLLSANITHDRVASRAFRLYVSRLRKTAEWLLKLDICYTSVGCGILQKTNPRHLMDVSKAPLYFSPQLIAARLASCLPNTPRPKLNFTAFAFLFPRFYRGHSLFYLLAEWCKYVSKKLSNRNLSINGAILKSFLLSHYFRTAEPDAVTHIKASLDRL